MAKIKECATGAIRTIRDGARIAGGIRDIAAARRDPQPDCIIFRTKAAARTDRFTAAWYGPGSLIYLLDPGSQGMTDHPFGPRNVVAWAYVVLED